MKKYIFINDTSTQKNWGCHSTSYHFEKFFENAKMKCHDKIYLKDLHDTNLTLSAARNIDLDEVDYLFINGEGSIYDNQSKGINIIKAVKEIKSRKNNIKVLFLNSTFDISEKFPHMKRELESIKRDVCLYGPRENLSYKKLKDLNFANVYLQPDFLYKEATDLSTTHANKNVIVIGGNSNYYRGDRPPYNAAQAYDRLIERISQEFNHEIILYSSDLADYRYLPNVAKKHNIRHLGCLENNWREGLNELSNAKISISGRYHPSIMSLCGHTPCYFISANNCKMEGTHNFFYDDDQNFSSSHRLLEDEGKIIKWIHKVESNYDKEVEIISSGLKSIKDNMKTFSSKVKELLK